MRMPFAYLPVCCSCTICRRGRFDRLSIRFLPTFAFLQLLSFLRLLVLLINCDQSYTLLR